MSAVWFGIAGVPEETQSALRRLASRGRLPQSVLLTGGDTRRQNAAAKALSAAVLCRETGGAGLPCGKCAACKKAAAGLHPDVTVLAPPEGKKTVSVQAVRDTVIGTLWTAPNEAANKVYVLPDAEELSPTVQNTLLKSLEEPPPFVMFLFLCDRRESLLPTVISRCSEFTLGESQEKKSKEAALAAETAVSLVSALCGGDAFDVMMATAPMQKNRTLMKRTAEALTRVARDALVSESDAEMISGFPREALRLAGRFPPERLLRLKDEMDGISAAADANSNENLLLCRFSAALAALQS